jgi:hypothetical protein
VARFFTWVLCDVIASELLKLHPIWTPPHTSRGLSRMRAGAWPHAPAARSVCSVCVGSDPKTRFILALSGPSILHIVSLVGSPRTCSPIYFPLRAPPPRLLPLSLGSRCCSDDATLMHRSDLEREPPRNTTPKPYPQDKITKEP